MENKIIDYKVISKSPKPEFEELCKSAILEGWTPFGGVSFLQMDIPKVGDQRLIGLVFSQAFVRHEQ